MTIAQVYDEFGRGFDFSPDSGILGDDITEIVVSDQPLGGGYFLAETRIEDGDGIDSAAYLYSFNSQTNQIFYERVEAYFENNIVFGLRDTFVTELDLVRDGIEAFFIGNDEIIGNSFDDRVYGFSGDDLIFGGGGVDTAAYFGDQTSYTLTLSPNSTTISDRRSSGDGTDQLFDTELLDFRTNIFGSAFDLRKFGGPASLEPSELEGFIELYIAYFNRAPDAIGLNFWGTAFANGTTLEEMAALFAPQEETLATYPAGTSNEDFAFSVYQNVLGREPDFEGFNFWVGQLDAGNFSRDQFILEVLRGVQEGSPDREYLDSKVDLGAYFAVHKGLSDVTDAAAAMALYDGSEVSITNSVNAINDLFADALDPNNGEFLMPLVGVLDDPFTMELG